MQVVSVRRGTHCHLTTWWYVAGTPALPELTWLFQVVHVNLQYYLESRDQPRGLLTTDHEVPGSIPRPWSPWSGWFSET
jgi:hypothetical protein